MAPNPQITNPQIPAGSSPGAPASGAFVAGDLYIDSNYVLYICASSGSPGTWVTVGPTAQATINNLGLIDPTVTLQHNGKNIISFSINRIGGGKNYGDITALPAIAPGVDGQILTLMNVGNFACHIYDDGGNMAPSGSKVFFGANSGYIHAQTTSTFIYSSAIGGWCSTVSPQSWVLGEYGSNRADVANLYTTGAYQAMAISGDGAVGLEIDVSPNTLQPVASLIVTMNRGGPDNSSGGQGINVYGGSSNGTGSGGSGVVSSGGNGTVERGAAFEANDYQTAAGRAFRARVRNTTTDVWDVDYYGIVAQYTTTAIVPSAGTTIVPNAGITKVAPTTNTTMTAVPTISTAAPVRDGAKIRLYNSGTANLVLQDRGTLASSGLYLTATSITLAPRGNVELTYLAALSGWVQTGSVVQPL